jgi:hypothetical protein
MRVNLKKIGGSTVLAGTLTGKLALNRLLSETALEPDRPEPIFLDFSGVEVATASFLRESVLSYRDIVRGRRSGFYPVIANANEVVRDELMELLRPRGDVLMACTLGDGESVVRSELLGELDPKQRMTFKLVREHGETDAAELMRMYGESEGLKHATAWNNRLSSLAALGLVVELSEGRAKRYRPLFQGI